MNLSTLLQIGVAVAAFPVGLEAVEIGKAIPATMFGANGLSCAAGWAIGMIPEADGGRREELARLLSQHGLSIVRMPGGTCANRFFCDSEARTREISRVLGDAYWSDHPASHMYSYYVSFDASAAFCRDADMTLIWQLNTATIHDIEGIHLLAASPSGRDILPARDYDHGDKLSVATESVRRFARHIKQTGLPIPLFEMGNEEYGHPALDPLRYSQIVRAYIDELHEELPGCTILVTLGDNQMVKEQEFLEWAETLLSDLAEHGYAERIDTFTMHYAWRSVCEFAVKLLDKHGFTDAKIAVTEFTCGWPEYWEKTPRYLHAVQTAAFVMDLMAVPRVHIATIHDLMSQNFGVFHYNQRSFEPPDDRSYDGRLGYQSTPTATAYAMLRPLAGATLLTAAGTRVEARSEEGSYLAVLTNLTDVATEQRLRPADHGLQAGPATLTLMTGESPEATTADLETRELLPEDGTYRVNVPPLSVARVESRRLSME